MLSALAAQENEDPMWVSVLWGKGYVFPVDLMRATSERKPIGAGWYGVEWGGINSWIPRGDALFSIKGISVRDLKGLEWVRASQGPESSS